MKSMQEQEMIKMKYRQHMLDGLSFEKACKTYVLAMRAPQYLSVQPVECDEFINGRQVYYFQKAVKRFSCEESGGRHCCSREELIHEAVRITGLPEADACSLLHRLFAFQPELTYSNRGALCKTTLFAEKIPLVVKEIAIPYDMLKRELPDEWYISLQIPDEIIDKMVWGCRKAGTPKPLPCSGRFAEQVLRVYKRRRGEFIRKYSFGTLKFLWLEYGSIDFPQEDVRRKIAELFRKMT